MYMCVSLRVYAHGEGAIPVEIGFPGAGVSGSCEQSDRRAGSELGSPMQE